MNSSTTLPQDVNTNLATSTPPSLTPKVDLSSAPSFRKKDTTNENELNLNDHTTPPPASVRVISLLFFVILLKSIFRLSIFDIIF
jgi:hypothetical protein